MGLSPPMQIARARFRYAIDQKIARDPRSRRLFAANRPVLKGTPARVLATLADRGIAIASLDDLMGRSDPERWAKIVAIGGQYLDGELGRMGVGSPDGGADERRTGAEAGGAGATPAVAPDDPLFGLGLCPYVLDVVNSFFGLWSQLCQFGLRLSMPRADVTPRQSAQAWHRDQWDQVKVFLYLTDVDEGNGALEYIPASRRGGQYAGLCQMPAGFGADGYLHPSSALIEQSVPAADRTCCAAPMGSVVFCDTSGLHRGGYALDRPRLVATWAYYRPSARISRDFRCLHDPHAPPPGGAAAFALS
jgi:Phytanoyl-CoA dioxygenase (PhyH)